MKPEAPLTARATPRLTPHNERCEHFTIHCEDDCIPTEEQDHPQLDDAWHTVITICLQSQDVGVFPLEQFLLLDQEMPRPKYDLSVRHECTCRLRMGDVHSHLTRLPLLALEGTASSSLLGSLPSSLEAGGEWSPGTSRGPSSDGQVLGSLTRRLTENPKAHPPAWAWAGPREKYQGPVTRSLK